MKYKPLILIILNILFLSVLGISQSKSISNQNLYLIIVSEEYENSPSLLQFITFREQDFSVQVVTSSNIGTNKDDYRNYIRNLMPSYVLLVGKYGDFPTHVISYSSPVESYNYYVASSLSGYPAPDIPLGLFMVENETELSNIVNKTINYETNLPSYPKIYYAHAGNNEVLPPWPIEFNEEILTEMNDKYFSPNGYTFFLSTANDSTPNDVEADINMINNGIRYMFYHGHGQIHKWQFGMGVDDLSQLNNTIYPIILSFACLTGSFSGEIDGHLNDCFAQKISTHEYGAVAFLGAYNVSGRGMNLLLEGAANGLFNDSVNNRLGDVLIYAFGNTTNSNTVNQYYPTVTESERIRAAWQYHLFGDPALKIEYDSTTSVHCIHDYDYAILFYPNPSNNRVHINISNEKIKSIKLYNLLGELIQEYFTNDFSVENLPDGIYFINTQTDKSTFINKLIKQ